ncbi:hypothetical protein GOP47_0010795 [Adiantum capillus-veneris]|uniref:Uncharacterized protein n=1 Tax=Adiantum capillus-veneris TaxID=13818 RepID=A0A9D4UVY1_ADICA|nr:hypothetical protein GOP47_0010795 [Adiantum capillus-veneris]
MIKRWWSLVGKGEINLPKFDVMIQGGATKGQAGGGRGGKRGARGLLLAERQAQALDWGGVALQDGQTHVQAAGQALPDADAFIGGAAAEGVATRRQAKHGLAVATQSTS